MCGPHHCLGRDAFASGPEILRRLLQLRQNASILEQGCAGFSPGSANRCDQLARHPGRTSPPLRPSLSFRYTQPWVQAKIGLIYRDSVHKPHDESAGLLAGNDLQTIARWAGSTSASGSATIWAAAS